MFCLSSHPTVSFPSCLLMKSKSSAFQYGIKSIQGTPEYIFVGNKTEEEDEDRREEVRKDYSYKALKNITKSEL